MIEPLRFCHEKALTYEINRPAFCVQCLSQRQTKNNPNLATFFCKECPNLLGESKEYGALLCKVCEIEKHKTAQNRFHNRQIVVVGPGLRKKMKVRGDGVSFPCLLDTVTVKLKARIYSNHQRIHTQKTQEISFTSGLSGKCLHLQVLGARNLNIADFNNGSDPFVVYSYYGRPISSTRVQTRTINPRWDNETFIVPMNEYAPLPREYVPTQKEMIKLEVYDYDWVTSNEFLGHVEMTRSKLMKLALISQEQPIRIPLTAKEFNGIVNFQFGYSQDDFIVKVLSAEDLDKSGSGGLNNPYVKVFLHDTLIGITPVVSHTIHPTWNHHNEFTIKLTELLEKECTLLAQLNFYKASLDMASQNKTRGQRGAFLHKTKGKKEGMLFEEFQTLPEYLALFRFEVYHSYGLSSVIRRDPLIGKLCVHCEQYRRILPQLPLPEAELTEEQQETLKSIKVATEALENTSRLASRFESSKKFVKSVRRFLGNTDPATHTPHNLLSDSSPSESISPIATEKQQQQSHASPRALVSSSTDQALVSSPPASVHGDDLSSPFDHSHSTSRPASRVGSALHSARRVINRTIRLRHNSMSAKQIPEILWTAKQRLPLIKQSSKKRKENLNAFGQEDYGFLIVRLILSNRGQAISGLDQAVQRMTIGETSMVKCRFDYAYGNFCFDHNIPPRSNVVFTVQLLEINGQGRWGILFRQIRRLFRLVVRMLKEIFRFIWYCGKYESTNEFSKKKKSQKKKAAGSCRSCLPSCFSGKETEKENSESDSDGDSQDDSNSDGNDSNADDYEREEDEDDPEQLQNLYEAGEESSLQQKEEELRVKRNIPGKIDPRMKKHWNTAVKAGASLMWKLPSERRVVIPPLPTLSEKIKTLQGEDDINEAGGSERNESGWENMNEEDQFNDLENGNGWDGDNNDDNDNNSENSRDE